VRLILLLAWRHLVFRPAATLLSVLGIALGIATVISVLTVDHNTLLSQQVRRIPSDPESDLLIQPLLSAPAAFDAQAIELRSQPYLRGVTGFATGNWNLETSGAKGGRDARNDREDRGDGGNHAAIELMAVEPSAAGELGAYVLDEGHDLDFTAAAEASGGSGPREILLSAGLARAHDLHVGDTVRLGKPSPRRAPTTKCVDGKLVTVAPPPRGPGGGEVLIPFEVVGILAPTHLGYDDHRALIGFEQGRALFGADLSARFWADFDTTAIEFREIEADLREHFVVHAPKRALAGLAPEEAAFRSGVRLCGFLALFLGLYIIFNTMSMSLVERVRQIGLLRALGVTRAKLLMIFVVEGLALSLLGAGLSLPLADRIVAGMQALRVTTLGFGKPLEIAEVPWGPVAAVLGAGVFFSLLGIVYPFLRASRLSVIDALRRGVIEMARDPFTGSRRAVLFGLLLLVPVAWLVGTPSESFVPPPLWRAFVLAALIVGGAMAVTLVFTGLLPGLARALMAPLRGAPTALARSTVQTARHRVFATVTGLMLVFAAVFMVVSVLESLKAETRRFNAAALDERLFLRATPETADHFALLRRNVPELAALSPTDVEVAGPFRIRAMDARQLESGSLAHDTQLRQKFRDKPTLLLSTRCSDDFGYEAGAFVTLATAADGPVAFEILAVSDEYGFAPDDRVYAVASVEMVKRYWCIDAAEQATAFTTRVPRDRQPDVFKLVKQALGPKGLVSARRGEEIGQGYLSDHDRDFVIFYAILLLTVALAAVGMLNAMVISVLERRREIGLLRSVGLTGGQVARMLLVEAGAFGVLGGLLGLAVGIPLATVSAQALTALSHLDLSFELAPRALSAVLAGAILVALLAVLYPALRANRLRLSTVMRYE
jgi:putative ABC transport system permease protein